MAAQSTASPWFGLSDPAQVKPPPVATSTTAGWSARPRISTRASVTGAVEPESQLTTVPSSGGSVSRRACQVDRSVPRQYTPGIRTSTVRRARAEATSTSGSAEEITSASARRVVRASTW